jgi:hypothetical protein
MGSSVSLIIGESLDLAEKMRLQSPYPIISLTPLNHLTALTPLNHLTSLTHSIQSPLPPPPPFPPRAPI